jgi:biopolymer transport protein ExbD
VDKQGKVYVDRVVTAPGDLLVRLKAERAAHPEEIAIISADGDASYRVFVDVLDKVRIAGFQKVSIEAKPERTKPE